MEPRRGVEQPSGSTAAVIRPPADAAVRSILRDLCIVLAAAGALFVLPSFDRPLYEPDEARYSEIPREMAVSGDWVTPRLDGVKYFEKPPLMYWLTAASIATLGLHEWALRLWPWLFGLAGCALVYIAGRCLFGRRAGLLAALVLATSPLYYVLSTVLILDMAVSVTLAAVLLAFLFAIREEDPYRRRWLLVAMYTSAALATLAKGLIGVALPGLVAVVWMTCARQWQRLPRCLPAWGPVLFLVIALPWHVLAALRNPGFAEFYFVHEQFLRFFTTIHHRNQPFWFFLPVLLLGMFPWSAFLPRALRRAWRLWRVGDPLGGSELFLVLWAGLIFAFFSGSESKLATYILPVFPALALLVGRTLDDLWERAERAPEVSWALPGLGLLFGVLFLAVPLALERPELAHVLRQIGGSVPPAALRASRALALAFLATGVSGLALRRPLGGRVTALLAAGALAVPLAAATLPAVLNDRISARELARHLAQRIAPGDEVMDFCSFQWDLAVYLQRRITIADCYGELLLGSALEDTSAWVIREPEFWRRWQSPERKWMVLDTSRFLELSVHHPEALHVEARQGERLLVTNRPGAVAKTSSRQ